MNSGSLGLGNHCRNLHFKFNLSSYFLSIRCKREKNGYRLLVSVMKNMEKAYWNHEVAKYLDIGESTLRKWCIELEKNGYIFIKGAKDSRAFTDHDLKALDYFKKLTKVEKHTLSQASVAVIAKYKREGENERTPLAMEENNRSVEALEEKINELLQSQKELINYQEKQKEFNKTLLKMLESQEKYIKESLDKRDNLLIESIRKSQEEKAAAIESQKKKSKWQQLKEIFIK